MSIAWRVPLRDQLLVLIALLRNDPSIPIFSTGGPVALIRLDPSPRLGSLTGSRPLGNVWCDITLTNPATAPTPLNNGLPCGAAHPAR